ncbi:MAG: hypothetical protein ACOX37_09550 [Bacillota bacterium]
MTLANSGEEMALAGTGIPQLNPGNQGQGYAGNGGCIPEELLGFRQPARSRPGREPGAKAPAPGLDILMVRGNSRVIFRIFYQGMESRILLSLELRSALKIFNPKGMEASCKTSVSERKSLPSTMIVWMDQKEDCKKQYKAREMIMKKNNERKSRTRVLRTGLTRLRICMGSPPGNYQFGKELSLLGL